jgi:Galactose oxidase, central domain
MRALLLVFACHSAPSLNIVPQQVKQGETTTVPLATSLGISVVSPDGLTVDSDGKTLAIHAGYQLSGHQQLHLRLDDHEGNIGETVVDVEVLPIGWQWSVSFTDPAPTAREHGVLVADDDKLYLIGGSGYAPQGEAALDAYWTFDLIARTWAPLTPAGDVPPPAASRRVALKSQQKLAYFFGGYETNTSDDNDLYRMDYSQSPPSFTKLTQTNPPPPRELHAFAYDPDADTFVAFGGISSAKGVLGDTWTMKLSGDTATWTQQMIPGPTPRYGFFFAFSAGTLYVWSGAQKAASIQPAQDTWGYDVAANLWTQLLDGSEEGAPPGRRNGAFIFDPEGPRLVIFGGTADAMTSVPGLSLLDLRALTWATLTLDQQPTLRSSSFGVYDPKHLQTILGFGNDRGLYRDLSSLGY